MYRLVSIWEAQKYHDLHVRQSECRGNRPWAAAVFEYLKNILLDFKNGHDRFITSVGPYGAY